MGDHTVAMTGAAMIGAALFSRQRTGKGQLVSTSLLRQGAYIIGFDVNIALMWGQSLSTGTREAMPNPSVNNYIAGDGKEFWIVGLQGDRHWPALARAIGRPEWLDDPRFATGRDRATNARELVSELDALFATRTRDEWFGAFGAEPDVFWAPVNSRARGAYRVGHVRVRSGSHGMARLQGDWSTGLNATRYEDMRT
jgi:crotonobetainyl-CoA:carnitine CoA-transferase CaiB-like acyl-CoA transferase